MRYKETFSILEKEHKETMLEALSSYTAFQKLVMTLLSARAKDSTTIPIVKKLFQKYPKPEDLMNIPQQELEKIIYSIGFHKVKAKNVIELSKIIVDKGNVPNNLEDLILLPGVGRKTANCLLSYHFGKDVIAVDIHVHRISNRLGWVKTTKPEETEIELMKILPKKMWKNVNRLLVGHGQNVCFPVKPNCKKCSINVFCPSAEQI